MKKRLTITLPDDLLASIDKLVDKTTIRNRSHAIEHLVRTSMDESINTAIILGGGTLTGAKNPLFTRVNNVLLLELQLKLLRSHGITSVIVCLSEKDRDQSEKLAVQEREGMEVTFSYEKSRQGTAGAIQQAMQLTSAQSLIVMHGDVLTSIALNELIKFHRSEHATVTLAVKPKLGKKELGQVYVQGNRVTDFSKTGIESEISIINTGVYVVSRNVLKNIPAHRPSNLETDVFPQLAKADELRAFIFQGIWYDISTPDQLLKAQQYWTISS